MNTIYFLTIDKDAIEPFKKDKGDAGYDVYSIQNVIIKARDRCLVKTGLSFRIPTHVYGRIASRSGLSLRHGIEVGAGVIDSSYRGEIGVLLYNHSNIDYSINKGDRIAQVVFELHSHESKFERVYEIDDTSRGKAGFGSSGY